MSSMVGTRCIGCDFSESSRASSEALSLGSACTGWTGCRVASSAMVVMCSVDDRSERQWDQVWEEPVRSGKYLCVQMYATGCRGRWYDD